MSNYKFVKIDIRDKEKVERVFKDNKPTIIYGDIRNKEDLENLSYYAEKIGLGTKEYELFEI